MSVRALIICDMQNDYFPGGSLAIQDAPSIVPAITRIKNLFPVRVALKQVHDHNHISFEEVHEDKSAGDTVEVHGNIIDVYPRHCVKGTYGCMFNPILDLAGIKIIETGIHHHTDYLNGFYDCCGRLSTGLHNHLAANNVNEVYVCGVATNKTVMRTAIKAIELGYDTYCIHDAIAAATEEDHVFGTKTMKNNDVFSMTAEQVMRLDWS